MDSMDAPNISSISLSSTRFDNLLQQHDHHPEQEESQSSSESVSSHDNADIHEYRQDPHYFYDSSLDPTATAAEKDVSAAAALHDSNLTAAMNRSLCWRSDPSRSLSDWQLQIFNRTTRTFDIYHVHKVVLAVGPRSCGYFQKAFRRPLTVVQTNSASSLERCTTRVPLIAQACAWVPHFLDFVYNKDSFALSSENAVGLLYLAEFFQNPLLDRAVVDFLEDQLDDRSSLVVFYVDAVYYDMKELLESVILPIIARELPAMVRDQYPYSDLLDEMSPTHFSEVLANTPGGTKETAEAIILTRLITKYCSLHPKDLSLEQFETFVHRISVLDSSSALTLLEASLEYDLATKSKNYNTTGTRDSKSSSSSLVIFQRECVGTLAEEWEQLLDIDQERITRIMRTLSLFEEHENVLVDWFQKTLIRASHQLLKERRDKENLKEEHDQLKKEHKLVLEDLEFAHNKYASLQRNYTTTKSEMKTQISSWVRKNEGHTLERQADEEQWKLDRSKWEMDRQKWENEKFELHRQLQQLQGELKVAKKEQQQQQQQRPPRVQQQRYLQQHQQQQPQLQPTNVDRNIRNLPSYLDDSASVTTEPTAENNSMTEDEQAGYLETYYHLTNGLHPNFRLF
jgi:BTB/POZ domain